MALDVVHACHEHNSAQTLNKGVDIGHKHTSILTSLFEDSQSIGRTAAVDQVSTSTGILVWVEPAQH